MEKKNYLQVYLEEWKYKMKKTKMTKFIVAELEPDSEFDTDTNVFTHITTALNKSKIS